MYRYKCFRSLAVHDDQWVLVPAKWTPQYGYAVIVTDDSANRISVTRIKGIARTGAANWDESNKAAAGSAPKSHRDLRMGPRRIRVSEHS